MNYSDGIRIFGFAPMTDDNKKVSQENVSADKQLKGVASDPSIDELELLKLMSMVYSPAEEEPIVEDDIDIEEATKSIVFFIAGKCFNNYASSVESNERREELSSYFVSFLLDNYDDVMSKINHDLYLSDDERIEPYIANILQSIIQDIDNQLCEEEPCEWERLKELLKATNKREDLNYVISLLDNGCTDETLNVLKMVFPKLIEVYNNRKK